MYTALNGTILSTPFFPPELRKKSEKKRQRMWELEAEECCGKLSSGYGMTVVFKLTATPVTCLEHV